MRTAALYPAWKLAERIHRSLFSNLLLELSGSDSKVSNLKGRQ